MHRALRKLLWLRLRGMLRRVTRNLKTVRGAVFSLLGALMLAMWLGPQLFALGSMRERIDPEVIRSVVPLGMLALCLFSVMMSGGQRGISFSPPEIDFLFSGPFTRREILTYKLSFGAAGGLLFALFLSVPFLAYARLWPAAFLGLWLTMLFIQLFSTALILIGQTVAERAYTRIRRLVLLAVTGVVGVGLWRAWLDAGQPDALQVFRRFGESWIGRPLLAPFEVFSRAMTAETFIPELVGWGTLALAIDLALLALVLRLDVNYAETSIAVSQKLYRRMQQVRRGGTVWTGPKTAWLQVPELPWLAGAGPVVRRQLIRALRSAPGLVVFLFFLAVPICIPLLVIRGKEAGAPLQFLLPMLVFMTVMLTRLLPFDFRGDLDQMDFLKSLPLKSTAIAAGQIVVPTLIMTGLHGLILLGVALLAKGPATLLAIVALYAPPFNFLVFGLENLWFLLFPSRMMASTPGDLQHVGRGMVEVTLKMLALVACCGLSAALGGLALLLSGGSWIAAGAVFWIVLAMIGAALVPCVAAAYRKFDVSIDTPP